MHKVKITAMIFFLFLFGCGDLPVEDNTTSDDTSERHNYWDYSITVKVINSYTNTPLEGVYLEVNLHDGLVPRYTDSQGVVYVESRTFYDFSTAVCSIVASGFNSPEYEHVDCCLANCYYFVAGTLRRITRGDANPVITIYLTPKNR